MLQAKKSLEEYFFCAISVVGASLSMQRNRALVQDFCANYGTAELEKICYSLASFFAFVGVLHQQTRAGYSTWIN